MIPVISLFFYFKDNLHNEGNLLLSVYHISLCYLIFLEISYSVASVSSYSFACISGSFFPGDFILIFYIININLNKKFQEIAKHQIEYYFIYYFEKMIYWNCDTLPFILNHVNSILVLVFILIFGVAYLFILKFSKQKHCSKMY